MLRALVAALLLAGCLRVGPGEDLHLVCEEKSGSPRMAYGVEDLLARTDVNGTLDGAGRVRILEAARHHVITPAGRAHPTFHAELTSTTPAAWRFVGVGSFEGVDPDVYDVTVEDVDGEARAPDVVEAPRTIRDAAWRAVNESGSPPPGEPARATWDPELPSCVSITFGGTTTVVNVVQGRVVLRQFG